MTLARCHSGISRLLKACNLNGSSHGGSTRGSEHGSSRGLNGGLHAGLHRGLRGGLNTGRHAGLAFGLAASLTLAGCGFHLRGSNGDADLPFRTIFLSVPETSPLGVELKRNIRATGKTQVVTDAKLADARLDVLSEVRDRTIQSLNSQGRIREYTLYYKMTFRVLGKNDAVLLRPTEIILKRDISFNESQVLAKESEEGLLYRDMQSDLVQQILRRLAALKPA